MASWFSCAISFHAPATICRLSQLVSSHVMGQVFRLPVPRATGSVILVALEPLPSSIFHLPSSIFHLPSSRLVGEFSEFSEFFSCILYTD